MSSQAQLQTTLARTSQPQRETGLLLALAVPPLEPYILPSTPSPKDRVSAWAYTEASTGPSGAVPPLSAFVAFLDVQRTQRAFCCLVATASLYSHPSDECFHRAPILPHFPCSPSVTRFSAYPAPCGNCAPCFFGFQKIFSANLRTKHGRKDFPNLPKMRRLALGAGHLASLRARVSRGQSGQIQTGEMTWHSTKTT